VTTLFYQPGIREGLTFLDPDESRHCVKVLRKRPGDTITLTDGAGFFYEVVITRADPTKCSFDIRNKYESAGKDYFIHVAISPTKNADRMEWFVEKATEFGIDKISLVECQNSERTFIRSERLTKVAISAMKQSIKAALPAITHELVPFQDIVASCQENEKCIAYVDADNNLHLKDAVKRGTSYCILIGPEGDFSPEELRSATKHGFKKVSLGHSRLRTETAGMAACHILNLINF
jgi:16S rRNA (uracil1498-N3)-methyltransferase